MTSDVTMNTTFEFRIQTSSGNPFITDAVLNQMVGAYTLGSIYAHRVESRLAAYTVRSEAENSWIIQGTRHPQRDDGEVAWRVELYMLFAGFYKSGFSVSTLGPADGSLPGGGQLTPPRGATSKGMRQIFQDHFPKNLRLSSYPFMHLAKCGEDIAATTKVQTLLRFPEWTEEVEKSESKVGGVAWLNFQASLSIEINVDSEGDIRSYRILGFSPVFDSYDVSEYDAVPVEVRTWGEAWVRHDVTGNSRLHHLLFLPNEIGLVTDRLYRYRIEKLSTLKKLYDITFGRGKSGVFNRAQWLEFASHYQKAGYLAVSRKCLQQAKVLAESELELAEIESAMKRLFSSKRDVSELIAKPRRRRISQLSKIVNPDFCQALEKWEQVREFAFAATDDGRYPIDLPGIHFHPITYEQLSEAEVPLACLSILTGEKYKDYPPEVKGLYNFTIQNISIWGMHDKGCYFVESIPDAVFYA